MRFLFPVKSCLLRVWERKKTLLVFAALCLLGFILGIIFITTPACYDYYLKICDRYVYRICFSQESVFLIFLERTAGYSLLVALLLLAGVHPAGLIVPPALLVYRAYTFGGSVAIFFSVYRFTGALIFIVLYAPVHLLIDAILLIATGLSCGRARGFRFSKEDFCLLGTDLLALCALVVAVCLVEALLLLALFHPLGNIL